MSDPTTLTALRDRLAADAAREGLLDVAYRTVDSPVGTLLLAATPAGLVRVAFDDVEGRDAVLAELARRVSPRVLHAPGRLDDVAAQLDAWFDGRRDRFDLALDHQLSSGFRRTVLARLAADVAPGTTTTYAGLAALAGSPRAVRAVGTACATNPIPLVVPCHRVVRSDGTTGAYRGGAAAKRLLLDLERGYRRSKGGA